MTYKPDGYNDLSAYLIVEGAKKLMDFLKAAFDSKELRLYGEETSVAHAEVRIGDSVLMLADATDQWPAVRSVLHVYVPDADEAYQRGLAAGATAVRAPTEREGDPDRRATFEDPFGNLWSVGTQISK